MTTEESARRETMEFALSDELIENSKWVCALLWPTLLIALVLGSLNQ